MTHTILGQPNEKIRQWILDHTGPIGDPPTIAYVMGEDEDDVNLGGCNVTVYGTNLENATQVEFSATETGEAYYTMAVTYSAEDNALHGFADFVGSSPQRGYARVTTPGGTATHAVEFSNH